MFMASIAGATALAGLALRIMLTPAKARADTMPTSKNTDKRRLIAAPPL
jgi:hypothetical protein